MNVKLRRSVLSLSAGIDEAGRGPLAGPVVAAAVVFSQGFVLPGLADSKALTPLKRDRLFDLIYQHALSVGVSVVDASRIDQTNILAASLEAMRLAFQEAQKQIGQIQTAFIDGNQQAHLGEHVDEKTVVGGDRIIPSIMAASIVAKVTRDRLMLEYANQYPNYGFEQHKGYGTRAHMEALKTFGPCDIHRKSFAPVKAFYAQT